jgi:hypothetical protein
MAQSRQARLNTVVEQSSDGSYFIYDPEGGQQTFFPDSPQWFTWLARRTSFHFTSQHGHFTARQERKQRGETYWYAYLKAHQQLHKQYLGNTERITIASLEQTAAALHASALSNYPEEQLPTNYPQKLMLEGLSLGSLTFQWNDAVLAVKTPTECHYLNRTQAAELLSYLFDQRKALLRKLV